MCTLKVIFFYRNCSPHTQPTDCIKRPHKRSTYYIRLCRSRAPLQSRLALVLALLCASPSVTSHGSLTPYACVGCAVKRTRSRDVLVSWTRSSICTTPMTTTTPSCIRLRPLSLLPMTSRPRTCCRCGRAPRPQCATSSYAGPCPQVNICTCSSYSRLSSVTGVWLIRYCVLPSFAVWANTNWPYCRHRQNIMAGGLSQPVRLMACESIVSPSPITSCQQPAKVLPKASNWGGELSFPYRFTATMR